MNLSDFYFVMFFSHGLQTFQYSDLSHCEGIEYYVIFPYTKLFLFKVEDIQLSRPDNDTRIKIHKLSHFSISINFLLVESYFQSQKNNNYLVAFKSIVCLPVQMIYFIILVAFFCVDLHSLSLLGNDSERLPFLMGYFSSLELFFP